MCYNVKDLRTQQQQSLMGIYNNINSSDRANQYNTQH